MTNGVFVSDLTALFEPRGVAVIGASHNTRKIGYRVVDNIVKGGYKGGIFPVNPKAGRIGGVDASRSINEVIGEVDVAVIAVPAVHVFDAVKNCARKHVEHLVIITSGFSEIGNNEEEREIVNFARDHGMRVLGPNIFGLYSGRVSLNATFGPSDIAKGNVSIVTQSGAIGIAMIGKTAYEGIGLSSVISVGNKADLDEADLVEYLIHDDDTRAILMYLEGVREGERMVSVLERAARVKPVVAIKSGRSARGAAAAASHTGSLAGSDAVFDGIMKQCGVMRAETIEEALDWCSFLSKAPEPKNDNTVIITNGGGVGVLAADASEKYGVHLYDDATVLHETFGANVPDFGSTKNPVDLTGAATAKDYDGSLSTALNDPRIGAVICLGCETAVFDAKQFTEVVRKKYADYSKSKPVVFSMVGGEAIENGISSLRRGGVPAFSDVDDAVSCMGVLFGHRKFVKQPVKDPERADIDVQAIGAIIASVKADGRKFMLANEAREVMEAAGVALPESMVAKNFGSAVEAARGIGYPVVMKIVSRDIIHKSDAGGIALNIENADEVVDAFESISRNCKEHVPNAHIDGIEITQQVPKGIETIVGARRDPSFGPIVMFGLGGIYVEVMKDVAFRAYPLSRAETMSMMGETRSYPLLLGARGDERKDIDAVTDVILRIGTIVKECPEIADIEINPLVVYDQGEGVKAVDVRILLQK